MTKFPVEGMSEEPVVAFAYPVRYGGTIPDDAYFGEDKNVDSGGMMAFDIKTSANAAAQFAENQAKLDQKAKEEKKQKETAAVGNLANMAAAAAAAQAHKRNQSQTEPLIDPLRQSEQPSTLLNESNLSDISQYQRQQEQLEQDREDDQRMDNKYVIAYLNWYSTKHGLWNTFNEFFAQSLGTKIVYSIFFNIGSAIGWFFMKNHLLPKICERFNCH